MRSDGISMYCIAVVRTICAQSCLSLYAIVLLLVVMCVPFFSTLCVRLLTLIIILFYRIKDFELCPFKLWMITHITQYKVYHWSIVRHCQNKHESYGNFPWIDQLSMKCCRFIEFQFERKINKFRTPFRNLVNRLLGLKMIRIWRPLLLQQDILIF